MFVDFCENEGGVVLLPGQAGVIEQYMPTVKQWALSFVRRKKGNPVVDVDDYIQAAYCGLVEYVYKHGGVLETDIARLRLYVKHEMFKHAWESLAMSVPYNEYIQRYLEVESKINSLDMLLATVGPFDQAFAALWNLNSDISVDERVDINIAVEALDPQLQTIYKYMRQGRTITEIAAKLGRSYTYVYNRMSQIRRHLKENAYPDFLTTPTENTEPKN